MRQVTYISNSSLVSCLLKV